MSTQISLWVYLLWSWGMRKVRAHVRLVKPWHVRVVSSMGTAMTYMVWCRLLFFFETSWRPLFILFCSSSSLASTRKTPLSHLSCITRHFNLARASVWKSRPTEPPSLLTYTWHLSLHYNDHLINYIEQSTTSTTSMGCPRYDIPLLIFL